MANAVSLFSGGGGFDIAADRVGFNIVLSTDVDRDCCYTLRKNRPDSLVWRDNARLLTRPKLHRLLNKYMGNIAVVFGGPPCQTFSQGGDRNGIQDTRGMLIFEFARIVREIQPKYFVMENVRGLLKYQAVVQNLRREFTRAGYKVSCGLLNAVNYGVPQMRQRLFFIGSRYGEVIKMPEPTHAQNGRNGRKHWVTVNMAWKDLDRTNDDHGHYLTDRYFLYDMIPEGGNWEDLPIEYMTDTMKGTHYRRLHRSEPSPTLIVQTNRTSTSLCHPIETRPISLREAARLQQFPDDWKFIGSTTSRYKQIGNAVPIGLGEAVLRQIMLALEDK